MPRPRNDRTAAFIGGWRSGLEEAVGKQLRDAGLPYLYEPFRIPYHQPAKPRKFTPDFVLPNGIVIETKGRFVTSDRQKHLLILAQYPDLDLRFVFSNSKAKLSKKSKTTYGKWCESKGFRYADRLIPAAWIAEPVNKKSLAIVEALS